LYHIHISLMIHFLLQQLYDIVKDNCEMGGLATSI